MTLDASLRIAVLITCHNRVGTTIKGVGSLMAALAGTQGIRPHVFLVDDGSTDDTTGRVRAAHPDIHVIQGSGQLFWNRGMCRAYDEARKHGSFDAYLLFNDDVTIEAEAVTRFFEEYRAINVHWPAVLAAATKGPDGSITYSAMRRLSKYRPLAVEKIVPSGALTPCDTFNGNFVLVPGPFFEGVGGLDRNFHHSYGDMDLGYVANRSGVPAFLASQPIGSCNANPPRAPAGSALGSLVLRLRSSWVRQDSMSQRARFIRKHTPKWAAPSLVALAALKRALERLTRHAII